MGQEVELIFGGGVFDEVSEFAVFVVTDGGIE